MSNVPSDLILPGGFWFRNTVGTHTSRTIMYDELTRLFSYTESDTSNQEMQRLVVEENILGKSSQDGRERTWNYLKQLYILDPNNSLYQIFRWGWEKAGDDKCIIPLLIAYSRDCSVRIAARRITSLSIEEIIKKEEIMSDIETLFPGKYSNAQLDSLALNVLSSFMQAGLLTGKRTKRRNTPMVGPSSLSIAITLGRIAGYAGKPLLSSMWIKILGQTDEKITSLIIEASRKGWIEYHEGGGMMSVDPMNDTLKKGLKNGQN